MLPGTVLSALGVTRASGQSSDGAKAVCRLQEAPRAPGEMLLSQFSLHLTQAAWPGPTAAWTKLLQLPRPSWGWRTALLLSRSQGPTYWDNKDVPLEEDLMCCWCCGAVGCFGDNLQSGNRPGVRQMMPSSKDWLPPPPLPMPAQRMPGRQLWDCPGCTQQKALGLYWNQGLTSRLQEGAEAQPPCARCTLLH